MLPFFIGASITAVFNVGLFQKPNLTIGKAADTFQACGTLLVDTNPVNPATASAASNLFRCTLAAAGLAALDALLATIGPGWSFRLLAAITLLSAPMAIVLQCKGMRWREEASRKS